MKNRTSLALTSLLALAILLSACGGEDPASTPTLSAAAIQTNAVATFSNGLTLTALFAPAATGTPPGTPTPFPALSSPTLSNLTPFSAGSGSSPTASCYRMTFVADMTIPDNTSMTPGQAFTKTWKIRNNGACVWDAGFKFAFTSGDSMSGAGYTLPQSVPANTETTVSVDMIAPNKTGTIKGNWRMSTAAGAFFGEEVYVQIVVGGSTGTPATATRTSAPAATTAVPSPTMTGTATETPTQTLTP